MNMKKKAIMKKAILLLLFAGAMFLFAGCGEKTPDENWFMENLPEEITTYTMKDQSYQSEVTSLEIEKRVIDEGFETAYCKIVLDDENLSRTLYLILSASYYDQSWHLFSYQEYQEEEVTPLKGVSESFLMDELSACGYTGISNYREDLSGLSEKHWSADCDVSQEYTYLTLGGSLHFEAEFIDHQMEDAFPRSYGWITGTDASGLTRDWKIDGNWTGATDDYRLELSISSNGDGTFTWNGRCLFDTSDGREEAYEDGGVVENGMEYEEKLKDVEDMGWSWSFWCGYPYCTLTLTPDDVYISISGDTAEGVQRL